MPADTRQQLFTPLGAKGQLFNNRMVMAPMTRSRAIDNVPNSLMAEYYAQRAGAGLIITEGTSPSPNGLGYSRIPGIYSIKQTEGWRPVTKGVHDKGGSIFMQLMHTGRITSKFNLPKGAKTVGPSAISAGEDMWTDSNGMVLTDLPEAMTTEMIQEAVQEFAIASQNAIAAGFDGIELHSANGYLLEQFLNPHANVRDDEYGGTVENRCRFVLEVAEAAVNAVGAERVGIRFSPYGTVNTMPLYDAVYDTYEYLAKELEKLGLLYLHIVDNAAREHQKGQELISAMRAYFSGIIILNGGYTQAKAEAAIASHEADMISFGTAFLANPDLPERFKNGYYLTQPDPDTFYGPDAVGYTDYPVSQK